MTSNPASPADNARVPFLNVPGETLLVGASPIEEAIRFGIWVETTGVDDVRVSRLSSVPLPVYPESFGDGKRWPGTKPEAMWHPLMWLPDRVARRYAIVDEDGMSTVENDDAWVVRVCLELTISGLYDETTATWFDVLASVGLDRTNANDLARVSLWLDGNPDKLLDSIDLTNYLELSDDPAWAVSAAAEILPDLEVTCWALAADNLLAAVDDLVTACGEGTEPANVGQVAATIAMLAGARFDLVQAEPEATQTGTTEGAWWAEVQESARRAESVQEMLEGPIADMVERLTLLREHYWPLMIAVGDRAQGAAAEAGVTHEELAAAGLGMLGSHYVDSAPPTMQPAPAAATAAATADPWAAPAGW